MTETTNRNSYDDLADEIKTVSPHTPAGQKLAMKISFYSTIEVRDGLHLLASSIDEYTRKAEVTSQRIWWLNFVLTAATVSMATYSILLIIKMAKGS